MWSFFLFQHVKLTLNSKAVITVLRVSQVFSSLGPYVSEVIPDASDSSQFTVTDSMPIISPFRVRTTYKVSVEMHADGFTGRSSTGLGTETESDFSAKVGKDDNTTEVTQNSTVTVSRFASICFVKLICKRWGFFFCSASAIWMQ